MLPSKHSSTYAVEEAYGHVQGESLKPYAALLVRLINSPITRSEGAVILAIFGCVFGVLAFVSLPILFVPLAAFFGLLGLASALLNRDGQGVFVAIMAGFLAGVGFVTSPSVWLASALLFTPQVADERGTEQALSPHQPALPNEFAWRMGSPPPPGIVPDKDGMVPGYDLQSGMQHKCFAPECLWFVKRKEN